ncbi:hypothetical protein J7L67_01945 [bacterium]|nr:hypothetical protein [bacterium]
MVPTTQQMLDNVNIAINASMTGNAVKSYTLVDGRKLERFSLDELLSLRNKLKKEIAGTRIRTTYVKFGNVEL